MSKQNVVAIILLAGSSLRMNGYINKAFMMYNGKKVINYSLDKFLAIDSIKKIILVYNQIDKSYLEEVLKDYDDSRLATVCGSTTRHLSLQEALKLVHDEDIIVHDAARPLVNFNDIQAVIDALKDNKIVTLYHKSVDAIKYHNKNLPKEEINLVTTPQGFKASMVDYLKTHVTPQAADELEVLEPLAENITYIMESSPNPKITYANDLESHYRIGHSLDFHTFTSEKELILGGVHFPGELGLLGHSDADCVYHAIAEALLGALGQGDLGDNYPDNDPKYLNIDSSYFLKDVKERLASCHMAIVNIDVMIYLEKPKLKEYKRLMAKNIAQCLDITPDLVSIKATTFEAKGPIGTHEGIASEATVLIKQI